MEMLKNYKNELIVITIVLGLIGYGIATAAKKVETKAAIAKAEKKVEVKKEHKKKPTLKKKYADKK